MTCSSVLLSMLFAWLLPWAAGADEVALPEPQDVDAAAPAEVDAATVKDNEVTVEDVDAQRARIEASDLDDGLKQSLKERLPVVLQRLEEQTAFAKSAAYFRESLSTAPEQTSEILREIDVTGIVEALPELGAGLSVEELRKEVEASRAELDGLMDAWQKAQDELTRVRSRPVEIGKRLPESRTEFSSAESKRRGLGSGDGTSLSKSTERMLAQAKVQRLGEEIEMLEQEQLSQAVRERLQVARRDLAALKKDNAQVRYKTLEGRLKDQREVAAEALGSRLKALLATIDDRGEEWQDRLEELQQLVADLEQSGEALSSMNERHRELEAKSESVQAEFKRIQEQVKLGAVDGGFSQVLMRQLRRLPNPRPIAGLIERHEDDVRKFLLSGFRVDEKMRGQKSLKKDDGADAEWEEMLEIREELLGRLQKNYGELVREASRFETDQRAYRDLILEVQKYLSAKLFWQRSSPLIGAGVLEDTPPAIAWSFAPENWAAFAQALRSIPARQPFRTALVGVVLLLLLVFRRPIKKSLEKSGKRIRRISTDRYSHTLRALLDSMLLALPVPLFLAFIALGTLSHPSDSDWLRGFSQGLLWVAFFMLWALGLREICRKGGMGEAHLKWKPRLCSMVRRAVLYLCLCYVPFSLVLSMMVFEESARHFDSAGRLAFVFAHVSIFVVSAWLFHPSKGAFADILKNASSRVRWRYHWLWYPLIVLIPATLVVLAIIGYLWTALVLSLEFQATLRILVAAVVVFGLLVRWFTIRQRRLALAEAIEERRAKREQVQTAGDEVESETPDFLEVSEEELELDDVVIQTRRLIRLVVAIVTVVLLWVMWSSTLPFDEETEAALSSEGLTWFSMLQLSLLIPIAVIVVRNLPGLMDLAGLRSSGLDTGSRFALTTICQYLVTAVAFGMVFELLNLDWAQFGWIAAALSVGLGFGLQEVVANFVCGIIILFERPIRIGDVVSLGNVTGTVTRIRMRATTITDWDRKDFVVPNKEFITGSLMNWTLSSTVNRMLIEVGVAYGTDTRKARELLLEIADTNPLVLDDPKPLATFEEFADSTLNLTLRCYLPNMDNRLRVRTELCEAIDERFKAAGIEIAFPQQDLHLRSVESSILDRKPPGSGTPA